MKLWIDDEREAPEGWTSAISWKEAMSRLVIGIAARNIAAISFDHDLGGEVSGYDLAVVLEGAAAGGALGWFTGDLKCHSDNPVGRQRIETVLASIRRIIASRNRLLDMDPPDTAGM